jgi:hypothetical protein
MRSSIVVPALLSLLLVAAATCSRAPGDSASNGGRPSGTRAATLEGERIVAYEGGLRNRFEDWGWAPRELKEGAPARVDMTNYAGWILRRKDHDVEVTGLSFRFRTPPEPGDFIGVRVGDESRDEFPEVAVKPSHRRTLPDGWEEVEIPVAELAPDGRSFDRVTIRARRGLPTTWVEIDQVAFICPGACAPRAPGAAAKARAKVSLQNMRTSSAEFVVRCGAPSVAISPGIYGIAVNPRLDANDKRFVWDLKPTSRRWGGNPASRYNWKLGDAWNTAEDWYWRNVNYTGQPGPAWQRFLDDNAAAGVSTALTMPMLGWVAKDTTSSSFPVSVFGEQQATDPSHPDSGNGRAPDGSEIGPADPNRTSVTVDERSTEEWVRAIVAANAEKKRRQVAIYMLDNEPMLWNSTHRDVHPQATTYDELLEKTLRHASAIRRADKDGKIAGPGLWGWPAYFYSALDKEKGFFFRPDRRAHDDKPLLNWWLEKLAAHEKKTGEVLLDYVDIHFYPQNVYNDKTDPETVALRLRSTRSLWDPSYVEETWIKEPVRLIPRMKEIIAESYPGRGLVIGEYSWGGEEHISGGLAQAEVLGRMGVLGVDYAYYWTYPPESTPTYWAFRAYRDYDGKGARFLDTGVPVVTPLGTSAFASVNASVEKSVVILINTEGDVARDAEVAFEGCGTPHDVRAFGYAEGSVALEPTDAKLEGVRTRVTLPPYSFTVVEAALTK